jgi:adenylosuccinate synthase
VRVCDLMDLAVLKPRMVELVRIRNLELEYVLKAQQRIVFDELWAKIEHVAQVLIPFLGDGGEEVYQALIAGKRVVFEGAQGTLLDQSFGAVPFVTSCHTIAGAAATGCGIGPKMLDYTLGVTKAYATRVGSGPFPTELSNATGDLIRERGGEFGTVTGRPRRCGWLDLVALRYACRLNGVDSLAITKLDVLSGIPKIQLCIRYKIDGKEVKDPPPLTTDHAKITPYFIELDGWEGDLSQARRWYQLPEAARLYLSSVSDILGRPISMISVGADREHTIVLNNATFIKNFMQVQE